MSVINRNSGSPIFNTLAEAQASNMDVGQLPIVLGTSGAFDGGGIIYSVQPNGSGGLSMSNGNELVKYTGTAAVLDVMTDLSDPASGSLMPPGAFGLGSGELGLANDVDSISNTEFTRVTVTTSGDFVTSYGAVMSLAYNASGNDKAQLMYGVAADVLEFRRKTSGTWQPSVQLYHTGNLLGTVSQSGGVPTGAVIERGSNANGEYVKFADGTLICTHVLVVNTSAVWTFPAVFSGGFDSHSLAPDSTIAKTGVGLSATTSQIQLRMFNADGSASTDNTAAYTIAIGRWF